MINSPAPVNETFVPPTLEESRRLLDLADQIKQLEPWEFLEEDDFFGVRNPATGELGFVSVMGGGGEHFCVAVYRGAEGLLGYEMLQDEELETDPLSLIEIPQLQLSFEDRDALEKEDHALLKQLKRKYRGANAWPLARTIRPGCLPWFMTGEETNFLAVILEQLLALAPRLQADPEFLFPEPELAMSADDEQNEIIGHYLVREAKALPDGTLVWGEAMLPIPVPTPLDLDVELDPDVFEKVAALPLGQLTLELIFQPVPAPVAEKNQRPYIPRLLLLVDRQSGMVVNTDMVPPLPSLHSVWEKFPQLVLNKLQILPNLPATIAVSDEMLFALLEPLFDHLPTNVKLVEELPAAQAAFAGLGEMMGFSDALPFDDEFDELEDDGDFDFDAALNQLFGNGVAQKPRKDGK